MADVGVDLHRKRSHVVALSPAGEVVLSRRIGNAQASSCASSASWSPSRSRSPLRPPTARGWFADLLADAGIPAHMAHPLATKAISAARVNNDAVDAKTLAHLLRTNLPPEPGSPHPRPTRPAG